MSRNGWNRFASFAFAAAFVAGATMIGAAGASAGPVVGAAPLSGMRDLGRADVRTPVEIAVILKYQHEAQLDNYIEEVSNPDSRLFGTYLTSKQFNGYFAPSPQSYARTIQALERGGFHITQTFANRTVIDAVAPAPAAERFFATEIHRVVQPEQGVRYLNVRSASIPAALRGDVLDVMGLNNLILFKPTYRLAPRRVTPPTFSNDAVIGQPLHGPDGGFGPLAFAQGYDMPVQHQIPSKPSGTTYDGATRTAGIVIPGDPKDTDLTIFLSHYAVTRTGVTTRIPIDGGPPGGGSSGSFLEASLDYQTIAGTAPGANIRIYEAKDFATTHVVDAYNAAVTDNLADTVNSSFGACETSGYFDPNAFQAVIKQGFALGQTFHASSGDSGTRTFRCSDSVSVLTPSDIPQVTSIGGTRLAVDSNGNYVSEEYWNDSSFDAGGGGVSVVFALPGYQKPRGSHRSTTGRNLPDLAFCADPVSGEDIVVDGGFGTVGGTSLASPIFGASLVEIDQVLGARVAHFDQHLYSAWRKKGYGSNLHDITTGTPYGILKPRKGYDLATGIGSMDVFNAATGLF